MQKLLNIQEMRRFLQGPARRKLVRGRLVDECNSVQYSARTGGESCPRKLYRSAQWLLVAVAVALLLYYIAWPSAMTNVDDDAGRDANRPGTARTHVPARAILDSLESATRVAPWTIRQLVDVRSHG